MALKKCEECGKLVSEFKKYCPNCGAPIEKSQEPTRSSTPINQNSDSSCSTLGCGFLLVLVIIFGCYMACDSCNSDDTKQQEDTTVTANGMDFSMMSKEEESKALKDAYNELSALYDEMKAFKNNHIFHEYEWSANSPAKSWETKAKMLNEKYGRIVTRFGFVPYDMITVATEWADNKGRDTDVSKNLKKDIESGLRKLKKESEKIIQSASYTDDESEEDNGSKTYVGVWSITNKYMPGSVMITEIYKQSGHYYEKSYDKGKESNATINRLEKIGNEYRDPDDSFGEYYVIKNGMLRMYNDKGDFTEEAGYRVSKVK